MACNLSCTLTALSQWADKTGDTQEKKAHNQEYNGREVECKSCGCKVKKCNWLRGVGGDIGGEGEGAAGRSWSDHHALLLQVSAPHLTWNGTFAALAAFFCFICWTENNSSEVDTSLTGAYAASALLSALDFAVSPTVLYCTSSGQASTTACQPLR